MTPAQALARARKICGCPECVPEWQMAGPCRREHIAGALVDAVAAERRAREQVEACYYAACDALERVVTRWSPPGTS